MVYRFGSLLVDGDTRAVYRDGERLPLTDKEFEVLHVLVKSPGVLVESDPLVTAVWGDSHVSKDNLRRHIHAVRRKIGEDWIVNVHNRGYYFAPLEQAPAQAPEPADSPTPPGVPDPNRKHAVRLMFGATTAALVASLLAWHVWPEEVQLVAVRQLTRDGRQKDRKLVSDGHNVYFNEIVGGRRVIASVPVGGGAASLLNLPVSLVEPLAVSLSRRTLLIQSEDGRVFEMPLDTTTLRALPTAVPGPFVAADWDPAGRTLAVSGVGYLAAFEPGKPATLLRMTLPGIARLAGWDPQGNRLRVEVLEAKSGATRWWEWKRGERTAHPLPNLTAEEVEHPGGWLSGGRFFAFRAGRADPLGEPQVWIADYSRGDPPHSYRLTLDSLSWRDPIGVPGSNTIVAAAGQAQGELASIPTSPDQPEFRPLLPGVPAYELEYSRDRRWIAYTLFPEHTIWRSRVDGGEALRLTPPGIEAHEPHWSPDGTRIAFMGKSSQAGAHSRIYLVPGAGGPLDEVLPQGDDQGVPTWSPDGRSIFFGDLRVLKGFERAAIHELFLPTRAVTTIPAPMGMWSPRMSPDGKYLAAISYDNAAFYIRDNARGTWRRCATAGMIEAPIWAPDSSWAQFLAHDQGHNLIMRVGPDCGSLKRTTEIDAYTFVGATWFGIAPDKSPIGLLRVPEEVYAIDWRMRLKFPEWWPATN